MGFDPEEGGECVCVRERERERERREEKRREEKRRERESGGRVGTMVFAPWMLPPPAHFSNLFYILPISFFVVW
jgi:hypothetical protein